MKRKLLIDLLDWKERESRKPLIIRGARQVGKTWLVREFAKMHYSQLIELNFEESPQIRSIFEADLNAQRIIRDIGILFNKDLFSSQQPILIFFDEIQECPNALKALRYFYEQAPTVHIIATGSLLDFIIEETGIPVGRVEFLHLFPLSFSEFLMARGATAMSDLIDRPITEPFSEIIHQKFLTYFAEYLAVGGMPEAVFSWQKEQSIQEIDRIHASLIDSYQQDFYKYAKKTQIKYLQSMFQNLPKNLGKKIIFGHLVEGGRSREINPCLDLLEMAKVVFRIYHSHGNGVPLGGESNLSKFKAILLDISLTQALLGQQRGPWILDFGNHLSNKGGIAEAFVGQEILANLPTHRSGKLFYWLREERNSVAEIDYLIEKGDKIIPIEVKSGPRRSAKSLQMFLKLKKQHPLGVLLSTSNYSREGNIIYLPLYAVSTLLKI